MLSININQLLRTLLACCLVIAGGRSQAQPARTVADFEVINRQAAGAIPGIHSAGSGDEDLLVQRENADGSLLYRVTGKGITALVPALTDIAVAPVAKRIWVFGDTIYNHAGTHGYVNVYDGSGQLIRAVGLVGKKPFAGAVAENGALAFVGNIARDGKPIGMLSLFDANGQQRWSVVLPPAVLARVFVADDHQQVAVSMYYPDEYTMKLLVFDHTGRLVHTHKGNVDGVAFLRSGKMILCQQDSWSGYDMTAGFSRLYKGTLPGTALGSRPVAIHPSEDLFFILSQAAAGQQVNLQAFDAASGQLVAQQVFDGSSERQRHRPLEATREGAVRFNIDQDYLSVRLK